MSIFGTLNVLHKRITITHIIRLYSCVDYKYITITHIVCFVLL